MNWTLVGVIASTFVVGFYTGGLVERLRISAKYDELNALVKIFKEKYGSDKEK